MGTLRAERPRASKGRRIIIGADPRIIHPASVENLGAILKADMHAHHLRASRITVLYLLAVAGGLCWVLMNWPKVLPFLWHSVAMLGWPMGLALALLLGVLEWKWNARLIRLTKTEGR